MPAGLASNRPCCKGHFGIPFLRAFRQPAFLLHGQPDSSLGSSPLKIPLPVIACLWLAITGARAEEPLDSLAEIRSLPEKVASRALPVRIEAVVIYANQSLDELIVNDGTASCYTGVNVTSVELASRPKVGDRVLLDGVTQSVGFLPGFRTQSWKTIGRSEIPAPYPISADEIYLPQFDTAWVEVPAVVTGVETEGIAFTLVVEVFGQTFKADVPNCPDASERAAALMQRPVRLRAVLGTVFNPHGQLTGRHFLVPSFDDIRPTAPAADTAKAPLLTVLDLLKANSSPADLVRLEGVVTQVDAKGFYLRDDRGSTFVQAVTTERLAPGTRVKVEGYGAIAPFRPLLRATRVTQVSKGPPPEPQAMDFHAKDVTLLQMEFVTVIADVVAIRSIQEETILQCQTDSTLFEALLPHGSAPHPSYIPGDRLRLTGICELTTTHPIPRPEWVNGFRIQLASQGAIALLRRGPWWTPARLYSALGMMTAAALLGIFGTLFFRRVVARQARVIGEKLGDEAVSEERDRMARDLHDTLEQQLAGVALQLDGLAKISKADPTQISSRLGLARRMLRHTRVEARRSVWDLRSKVLEVQGLGAALRSMVAGASSEEGPAVLLEIGELTRPLPPGSDFHLLRIAQEALANAIKHAAAREVVISLHESPEAVTLIVRDDGCGFVTAPPDAPVTSHFGILGMHERVEKIGAALDIQSSPGHGCSVTVTLPTRPHP
jgi:signal transduction histidine kinase